MSTIWYSPLRSGSHRRLVAQNQAAQRVGTAPETHNAEISPDNLNELISIENI